MSENRFISSNGHDPLVLDRESRGDRVLRISCEDLAAVQDQVGRAEGHAEKEDRQRSGDKSLHDRLGEGKSWSRL